MFAVQSPEQDGPELGFPHLSKDALALTVSIGIYRNRPIKRDVSDVGGPGMSR
jgi:hypothetical protein